MEISGTGRIVGPLRGGREGWKEGGREGGIGEVREGMVEEGKGRDD